MFLRSFAFFLRTSTSSGARLPRGGEAACHLVASVVGFLEDLPGYISAPYTKRYRHRKGHGSEQDQERRRRKLHRDAKLRDRHEHRVDDDGVSGDAGQQIRPRCSSDYARQEVGQQRGQYQYQYRGYDGGDVGDKLSQNRRDLRDTQSVGGHGDGDDKTNQNTSLPKILCGVWLVSALSKNCFIPPRSIHPSKPMPCNP